MNATASGGPGGGGDLGPPLAGKPWARIIAAVATDAVPHRLLFGDGPQGLWCGTGAVRCVLGATARRVGLGRDAAPLEALDGGETGRDHPRPAMELDVPSAADLEAVMDEARERLDGDATAASARSMLVGVMRSGELVGVYLGLGPPSCAVLVRCWPGIAQGPDGAGTDGAPAPLAVAAEEAAAALAGGRLDAAGVTGALAPARAAAFAEGVLAERQARLMDAAGDDAGGTVRRVVAQFYAVDIAVRALRGLAATAARA